jgi:hypothetical protein
VRKTALIFCVGFFTLRRFAPQLVCRKTKEAFETRVLTIRHVYRQLLQHDVTIKQTLIALPALEMMLLFY